MGNGLGNGPMTEAEARYRRGLRVLLEENLRELAEVGAIPERGERESWFRVVGAGQ